MRLTLRTMLAYIDDILEPDDAREIGKKIEESEFATELLQRTRDVMRRLRLAAPSLTDRGPGLDPNTVAEYLDNTLPADRVPDFEKVCLESDMHLAEVASCHQILTLVLGEPAEVDMNARQRMYQLHELPTAQPVVEKPPVAVMAAAAAGVPSEPARKTRSKRAVPEYLREPKARRRRLVPWAVGGVLLCLAAIVALAATEQFRPGSRLAGLLGISSPAPEIEAEPKEKAAVASGPTGKATPQPAPTSKAIGTAAPVTPGPSAGHPAVGIQGVASVGTAPKPASLPVVPPVAGAAGQAPPASQMGPGNAATVPASPAPGGAASIEFKPSPAPSPPGAEPPNKSETPALPAGKPEPTAVVTIGPGAIPTPPGEKAATGSVPRKLQPPPGEPSGAEPAPLPPERLGRFVSDKQILLQYDTALANWRRVTPQAAVSGGIRLLALPLYQPTIAMPVGTTVHMLGGTQIELLPSDAQGVPGLNVHYGRVGMQSVGENKPRFRLQLGQRTGLITFKNPESHVAVAVFRIRTPGTDPEAAPGVLTADLYALSGEFSWEDAARQPGISVTAPAWLTVNDQPTAPPLALREIPKWVTADEADLLDRRAAPMLEEALQFERPAGLGLRELVGHRQREVASLASRCLGYIGQFEPMVAALNAPEQRSVWDEYIYYLQLALSRGPDVAVKVRQALEQRYPQEAPDLYRMLWGYTERQIQSGEGAKLVRWLDSEPLAGRVLGFYNLEKLTGVKYSYHPYDPPLKRQVALARWKERLQTGLITPKAEGEKKPTGEEVLLPSTRSAAP